MAKWLELCPPNLDAYKGSRILLCSRHFRRDQYLNINAKKPKLVHNAVPFKKHRAVTGKVKISETQSNTPAARKIEIHGHQPVVWIPERIEDQTLTGNKQLEDPLSSGEFTDEDSLVYEVDMEDSDDEEQYSSLSLVQVDMKVCDDKSLSSLPSSPPECSQNLKESTFRSNLPANQEIVLENIHLKLDNEDLQTELNSCKQRLALLERHVHSLSKLAVGCECICNSCIN